VVDRATATTKYFTATVDVINHASSALAPHFIVSEGLIPQQPASVLEGPVWLMPGASAEYLIRTPQVSGLPGPGQTTSFVIYATTTSPNTFAVSPVAVCAS
jgi:hypothetical protein